MNKAISIFNEISHEYKMAYEMVNQIGDSVTRSLFRSHQGSLREWAGRALGFFFILLSCTTATPFYFTYWTLMCVFWMCVRWTFRVSLAKYSMMLWFGIYIFILKRSYVDCPLFYTLRLSKSNGVRYLSQWTQQFNNSNNLYYCTYCCLYFSPYEPTDLLHL